jgi:hypothetical protein
MALEFTTSYLTDALALFRQYKRLGDGALAQCPDDRLSTPLDPDGNSVAILVKHLACNMRSRFTAFLTSDGEKPDRDRDSEFVDPPADRAALIALWERGWAILFAALEPLTDDDMTRVVTIRGERHSVMQAIHRQIGHYAYHVGQVVFLAKHFCGPGWRTLSVPRNQSAQFNADVAAGTRSQR